jgi:hypothetical protein
MHFLDFFCKLFAVWRASLPDFTWSVAFATCLYQNAILTHKKWLAVWNNKGKSYDNNLISKETESNSVKIEITSAKQSDYFLPK